MDLEKPGIFFSLNSTFLIFGICQMVFCLIRLLFDHFDPKKTEMLKLWGDIMVLYH